MKQKICIIFSTRPEIIKLFPIIKKLSDKKKKLFFFKYRTTLRSQNA